MSVRESQRLCLECGLCCNGVIFARGELRPQDDAERLKTLGLALVRNSRPGFLPQKFHQPCAALEGCRCRIYADRPQYCRQFECLLFQALARDRITSAAARRIVRKAVRQSEKVQTLLRTLGEDEDRVALSVRFRRLQKRFERGAFEPDSVALYGELTLAMHELNLLLSKHFYPG